MRVLIVLLLLAFSVLGLARDRNEVRLFRSKYPCPATGHIQAKCPGYVVDHIVPLCAGGADRITNMQFQLLEQSRLKDKIEIRYCRCLAREIGACK